MTLVVQNTLNGSGIVASRDFAAEEILYEVTGEMISGDADEDIDEKTRNNAFRFSEDLYISPDGSIGDFQNHSCVPNAKVIKKGNRLFVAAVTPIHAGEEVLIDYSTITAADDVWEMQCNCESGRCRGVVGSFDTLPDTLQKKYRQSGMVPHYILES